MDDSHRRFLQVLMRSGIVDEPSAKQLHRHCCNVHNAFYSPDHLDGYINTINSNLEPMFMQIRKGMCENSGVQHYALMDLVVDSDTGRAFSTEILNCANTLTKKTKKKDTEQLLNRLVRDNWLIEKEGEYCLSTRCIIEMEQYIRTMYQDQVKVCRICHNIVFQNQICENPTCGIKIHNPCVARFFQGATEPRCPACNDIWPHEIPAIEERLSESSN